MDLAKQIKKCVECGELDYILLNETLCSECKARQKKRNEEILKI